MKHPFLRVLIVIMAIVIINLIPYSLRAQKDQYMPYEKPEEKKLPEEENENEAANEGMTNSIWQSFSQPHSQFHLFQNNQSGPPPVEAPPPPDGNPDAPFDDCLWILILAGLGYGVIKYKTSRKANILVSGQV